MKRVKNKREKNCWPNAAKWLSSGRILTVVVIFSLSLCAIDCDVNKMSVAEKKKNVGADKCRHQPQRIRQPRDGAKLTRVSKNTNRTNDEAIFIYMCLPTQSSSPLYRQKINT